MRKNRKMRGRSLAPAGALIPLLVTLFLLVVATPASAQSTRCEIPREARDIWRCERGFVIGPENVIIRLPIPETDPEVLYNAGIEAAGREDWRVAIAYFTAAHQRAHLVPRYMYNLGLAHARAGNEVPAIAWLAAYLVAEPTAPNRAAIWTQIAELEAAAQRKASMLWDRAIAASNEVPALPLPNSPLETQRYIALSGLLQNARSAGDLSGAHAITEATLAAGPAYLRGESASFVEGNLHGVFDSALEASDLVAAESLLREMRAPPEHLRARIEEVRDHVARNIPTARADWSPQIGGGPARFLAGNADTARTDAARQVANNETDRLASLVVIGRAREALDGLASLGHVSQPREFVAADVGIAFVFVGDLANAERALAYARTYAAQVAQCYPNESACGLRFGALSPDYGWAAARLEAFMLSERGRSSAAVEHLETFYSRRIGTANWPARVQVRDQPSKTFGPNARWIGTRSRAMSEVVGFLLQRGRASEALALANDLDSMNRAEFLEWIDFLARTGGLPRGLSASAVSEQYRVAVAQAAGNGPLPSDERRAVIEASVLNARRLGGAAYDLDWWLRHVQAQRDPARQVMDLGSAGEDLLRGIRRTRSNYRRAGGTWGQ